MALTDRQELSALCIKVDGVLEVRTDRVISEGTEELGRKAMRTIYTPDMDPATLPPKVRAVANLVWTTQIKADWATNHPVSP